MLTLTWQDPPANAVRIGRPNVRALVLAQLRERPEQWAIYPTKTLAKKSLYVLSSNFRKYAQENGAQIEVCFAGSATHAQMYVRFVANIEIIASSNGVSTTRAATSTRRRLV